MIYTDQMSRQVELKETPKRIVSVVPSQTELLYDLGLEEEVVGITKFCIHPEKWFRTKTRVGGTKQLDIQKIIELNPDLILANKEENVQLQVESLAANYPVWVSDVTTLEEAMEMIGSVGKLVCRESQALQMAEELKQSFAHVDKPGMTSRKAAYLIWKDPYMTAGGDTFIHDMLRLAGFSNLYAHQSRYPEINVEDLKTMGCEVLLLSSEPYPFKQKHVDELHKHLPDTSILLVDGELFSWYGSRLLRSAAYFEQLRKQIASIS